MFKGLASWSTALHNLSFPSLRVMSEENGRCVNMVCYCFAKIKEKKKVILIYIVLYDNCKTPCASYIRYKEEPHLFSFSFPPFPYWYEWSLYSKLSVM